MSGHKSTGDAAHVWAEKFCLKARKMGTPSNRKDWQVIISHVIVCSDDVLQALAEKSRTVGVSWLTPVIEGILEEMQAGRAFRDTDGAVTLRAKPQAAGLSVLL